MNFKTFIVILFLPLFSFSAGETLDRSSVEWRYNYSRLDDYLGAIEFQKNEGVVKINNYTTYPVEDLLTLALQLQGVRNVTVDIYPYLLNMSTQNLVVYGFVDKYSFASNHYAIYITQDCSDLWGLILHESCHIAQYEEGHLEKLSDFEVRFDNELVNLLVMPYNERIHEIDARNRDLDLRGKIVDAIMASAS